MEGRGTEGAEERRLALFRSNRLPAKAPPGPAKTAATFDEALEDVEVGIEMDGGPATVSAGFALQAMDATFLKHGCPTDGLLLSGGGRSSRRTRGSWPTSSRVRPVFPPTPTGRFYPAADPSAREVMSGR
jgi:hypothetical protein